jgi:ribosomal-protein-alanine N-acetyltransferase
MTSPISLPSSFPVLTTNRLVLRQILPSDAAALFAIKGNPAVTARYGMEPHHSLDFTLGWIERRLASFADGEGIAWAVTLRGEDALIGSVTLWNFDFESRCGELGYELHPAYEKHGIMTEAARAAVAYAFASLALHRVEASTFHTNTASRNLLLRLGFKYEGAQRQRTYFRGEYFDQVFYGLLKDEFSPG